MKIWAKVTGLHFRTCHRYPDGAELKDPDAKTIQHLHSHRMYVTVMISQEHADRDVEYITLENELRVMLDILGKQLRDNTSASCETIALIIYNRLKSKEKYAKRNIIVEVSEDNHNGTSLGDY